MERAHRLNLAGCARRAGACAALSLLASDCGGKQGDTLVDPMVLPGMYEGRKVGCDLSFHLVRTDDGKTWKSAIGVTLLRYNIDGQWLAGLKIGYQPSPGVVVRPTAAFLYNQSVSNEGENTRMAPGEDPRYLVVQFGPDAITRQAFALLEDQGIAQIGFRLNDGQTQIWTLDLDRRPDIRKALDLCLGED